MDRGGRARRFSFVGHTSSAPPLSRRMRDVSVSFMGVPALIDASIMASPCASSSSISSFSVALGQTVLQNSRWSIIPLPS